MRTSIDKCSGESCICHDIPRRAGVLLSGVPWAGETMLNLPPRPPAAGGSSMMISVQKLPAPPQVDAMIMMIEAHKRLKENRGSTRR